MPRFPGYGAVLQVPVILGFAGVARGLLPGSGRYAMTPSVVTLQEVLRHHRTLSRRGRDFYESLLAHGDVLAVRLDYLPGAMLWLVTTPKQARLMRKAREGRTTSDVCVMSLD